MPDHNCKKTIEDFVKCLEFLRTVNGITQQDFGKIIGCNRTTYGRYIRGERTPPLEALIRAFNHFNIPTDYLLGFSNAEKPIIEVLIEISNCHNIPIDKLIEYTKVFGDEENEEKDFIDKTLFRKKYNTKSIKKNFLIMLISVFLFSNVSYFFSYL
jgi:transcriptional regulator with XRE-family HTH domain